MWNVIIPSARNRFPILNDPVLKMVDVAACQARIAEPLLAVGIIFLSPVRHKVHSCHYSPTSRNFSKFNKSLFSFCVFPKIPAVSYMKTPPRLSTLEISEITFGKSRQQNTQ